MSINNIRPGMLLGQIPYLDLLRLVSSNPFRDVSYKPYPRLHLCRCEGYLLREITFEVPERQRKIL